jgi:hypothetical protein
MKTYSTIYTENIRVGDPVQVGLARMTIVTTHNLITFIPS